MGEDGLPYSDERLLRKAKNVVRKSGLDISTRTPGGGGLISAPPPLRFFADNAKTAARSAAALGIAVHSSFPHIVLKFWPRVMSGQVTSPHHVTQPPKKFEAASKSHL